MKANNENQDKEKTNKLYNVFGNIGSIKIHNFFFYHQRFVLQKRKIARRE